MTKLLRSRWCSAFDHPLGLHGSSAPLTGIMWMLGSWSNHYAIQSTWSGAKLYPTFHAVWATQCSAFDHVHHLNWRTWSDYVVRAKSGANHVLRTRSVHVSLTLISKKKYHDMEAWLLCTRSSCSDYVEAWFPCIRFEHVTFLLISNKGTPITWKLDSHALDQVGRITWELSFQSHSWIMWRLASCFTWSYIFRPIWSVDIGRSHFYITLVLCSSFEFFFICVCQWFLDLNLQLVLLSELPIWAKSLKNKKLKWQMKKLILKNMRRSKKGVLWGMQA